MVYDCIIVGAGPAGLACALRLARAGKQCLVLEKRPELKGKVCGDGFSSHCLSVLLNELSIPPEHLLELGGKKINCNITSVFGKLEEKRYAADPYHMDFGIGLSRDVFDTDLCRQVQAAGAIVQMNSEVISLQKKDGLQLAFVRGRAEPYAGKALVAAVGACHGARLGIPTAPHMPAGISARILGRSKLRDDAFYFKYDWAYGDGYAWIFPVGDLLWNIGVWSGTRCKQLKTLFAELLEQLKTSYFDDFVFERRPRGALLGVEIPDPVNPQAIILAGDCAHTTDHRSGEGISYAIESGLFVADSLCSGAIPSAYCPTRHDNIFAGH